MPATPTSAMSSSCVAHEARRDCCFFRYGQVAGSGADHADGALAGDGGCLMQGDSARGLVIFGARFHGVDGLKRFGVGAGGEHVAAGFGHVREDGGDLRGGFAWEKITSGMPVRRARWWSSLAKPMSSKGNWRRRSSASVQGSCLREHG